MMGANAWRNAPREPRLIAAGVLALLVHLAFLGVLIFGFDWKSDSPKAMQVDLWSSLPRPVIEEAPPVKVEPVPPPVKLKPLAPEPAVPQIALAPNEPDIVIKKKERKEKERQEKERKEKERKEKERKEKERKEKERKEKERKIQQEQDRKEQQARVAAEVERLQQAQQQEADRRSQAAAQARANEIDEYKARILARIKSRIVMPPDLPGDPVAEFDVTLLPGGDILDVRLRGSSGFPAFDNAVERAIFLSKPLPLPPDPALFPRFRNLNLKVHYRE